MAEYIERSAAIKAAKHAWAKGLEPSQYIEALPAADVAPLVHSYWEHKIANDGENIGICHNCKYPVNWFWKTAKYCPNCGAKMDEGADNDTN